jgi:hypothetical protein
MYGKDKNLKQRDENLFFFFKNISLENRSINTVLTHVFVLIIDMHRFFLISMDPG